MSVEPTAATRADLASRPCKTCIMAPFWGSLRLIGEPSLMHNPAFDVVTLANALPFTYTSAFLPPAGYDSRPQPLPQAHREDIHLRGTVVLARINLDAPAAWADSAARRARAMLDLRNDQGPLTLASDVPVRFSFVPMIVRHGGPLGRTGGGLALMGRF